MQKQKADDNFWKKKYQDELYIFSNEREHQLVENIERSAFEYMWQT